MQELLYRVWVILEDGSRGPILSSLGSWLMTGEEIIKSPFISMIKAGNPMQVGRDKSGAFQGPRDIWVDQLGYSPDDFILITDVKVEEATTESQSRLPYTEQSVVHNFAQGLVGIITPGWPVIVFSYTEWDAYIEQLNDRAKDIGVERELFAIRKAQEDEAMMEGIYQFLASGGESSPKAGGE